MASKKSPKSGTKGLKSGKKLAPIKPLSYQYYISVKGNK